MGEERKGWERKREERGEDRTEREVMKGEEGRADERTGEGVRGEKRRKSDRTDREENRMRGERRGGVWRGQDRGEAEMREEKINQGGMYIGLENCAGKV